MKPWQNAGAPDRRKVWRSKPAGTTILYFDNASELEPLSFIAFYLLGAGEHELIRMLE